MEIASFEIGEDPSLVECLKQIQESQRGWSGGVEMKIVESGKTTTIMFCN